MPIKPSSLPPTIFETFPRVVRLSPSTASLLSKQTPTKAASTTSTPAQILTNTLFRQPLIPLAGITTIHNPTHINLNKHTPTQVRTMTTSSSDATPLLTQYKITTSPSALSPNAGVSLTPPQTTILCSILDLFSGTPSKRKLTLWTDSASFHDPLTNATGRKQFEAQWYGLRAAFSSIERLGCKTVSAGNPMEMQLKTKYKVKGLGSEQVVESVIAVHTEGQGEAMRVVKVEDKWDGEIKEGPIKSALRGLNSVTVPAVVR